jgi:hypothetical protein
MCDNLPETPRKKKLKLEAIEKRIDLFEANVFAAISSLKMRSSIGLSLAPL